MSKIRVRCLLLVINADIRPVYEIEPSLKAEAKSLMRELIGHFRQLPNSIHWPQKDQEALFLGFLAEKVIDMALNQLKIPHIWNHPLICRERLKRRQTDSKNGDFVVNGLHIDIKTCLNQKNEKFFINEARFLRNPADIYLFLEFNKRLTRARIIGWLWREEVKGFSIRNLKFGRAISVPKESLRPFSELIEVFQSENSRIRPKLP